jgi:rare lipoprotein A
MVRFRNRQFRKYVALAISVSALVGLNSPLSAKEMQTPVAEIAAPTVEMPTPVAEIAAPTVEMPKPVAEIVVPTVAADYPAGSIVSPVNQKSVVKVQKAKPVNQKSAVKVQKAKPVNQKSAVKLEKTNFARNDIKTSLLQTGVASYYGPGFHGRRTANGETFNQNAMTAAHRTLPFGTKLKVTNLANGQSAIVRVNDRGPYAGGRVLDLSVAAAKQIGSTHSGVAKVKIEVVSN